jgi:hypothetical protein
MSIKFSRELIKGRITEVIFEQMIREEGNYTVIPFGYEHTVPMLAQYQDITQIKSVMQNIKDAPDFALISNDKTKVYLVEVKYQSKLNVEILKEYATRLLERWDFPWLFVATPEGFFCGLCKNILDENHINPLSDNWVVSERRADYLNLLNEFERK